MERESEIEDFDTVRSDYICCRVATSMTQYSSDI